MAKETIGIIGPGRMGLAMTKLLIKMGYPVVATDVNAAQLRKAKAAGAETVRTAAGVAKASKFIIIAVGFDAEARDAMTGKNGLMETLQKGSVIAVSSTVSPKTVQELDEIARTQGSDVLDAPICRGGWAADAGTLLALIGGKNSVVKRARPIYSCFCSDIQHLGGVGYGQFGKAMNNFLLWVNTLGIIEAGRMSEAMGADLPKLRKALQISSAQSQAMADWDNITFTWALDDMHLCLEMSDQLGLSLPLMGAVKEMVKEGRRVKRTNPPDWSGNWKKKTK